MHGVVFATGVQFVLHILPLHARWLYWLLHQCCIGIISHTMSSGFFIVCSYVKTKPHGAIIFLRKKEKLSHMFCHFIPGILYFHWMGLYMQQWESCQFVLRNKWCKALNLTSGGREETRGGEWHKEKGMKARLMCVLFLLIQDGNRVPACWSKGFFFSLRRNNTAAFTKTWASSDLIWIF